MSEAVERQRPAGVTFVVILTWIAAIGDLLGGITLFVLSFSHSVADTGVDIPTLRYYAMTLVIVGLLTALVANGLGTASQFARSVTIVVMALRIASALWALIAIRHATVWSALFDLIFALFIIGLLTSGAASDYFRGRTPPPVEEAS